MLTRVHVNRHHITHNRTRPDAPLPVFTIKRGKRTVYADEVVIDGPARMVYRPAHPLSCGAVAWLETDGIVMPILHQHAEVA